MNISKSIKKINLFVALLILMAFIGVLYYFIPSIFVSLSKTILGNIILLLLVLIPLSCIINFRYGVILLIIFIILTTYVYLSSNNQNKKEGFVWSNKTIDNFLRVEKTLNRNTIFDPEYIQNQASEKEVDYLLKNNMWPWDNEVKNLYEASVLNNVFVQTHPKDSVVDARKTYNQKAILDILSGQSKEGRFLSTGVEIETDTSKSMYPDGTGSFGYNSGLIANMYRPTIKCHPKNQNSNEYVLKKQQYIGNGGIMGEANIVTENVDINNLEKIIPGFKFLKGPCNPCSGLPYNNDPKYDCPFSLNIKNTDNGISLIWKYLWSLNKDPVKKNRVNTDYEIKKEINANNFKLPPFNF